VTKAESRRNCAYLLDLSGREQFGAHEQRWALPRDRFLRRCVYHGIDLFDGFPVTADAIQPSISGGGHVFLTELKPRWVC